MANFEPHVPLHADVVLTFRQLSVSQLNGFSIAELKHVCSAQVGGRPPDVATKPVWLAFAKRVRECALAQDQAHGIPAVPPAGIVPPVPAFPAPPVAVEPPPAPQAPAPVVANIFVIPAKEQMVMSALSDLAALDRPLVAPFPAAALYTSMLQVTLRAAFDACPAGALVLCPTVLPLDADHPLTWDSVLQPEGLDDA